MEKPPGRKRTSFVSTMPRMRVTEDVRDRREKNALSVPEHRDRGLRVPPGQDLRERRVRVRQVHAPLHRESAVRYVRPEPKEKQDRRVNGYVPERALRREFVLRRL